MIEPYAPSVPLEASTEHAPCRRSMEDAEVEGEEEEVEEEEGAVVIGRLPTNMAAAGASGAVSILGRGCCDVEVTETESGLADG